MTRLFLGPVPPDFECGIDQVIGAWCFLGKPSFLGRQGHQYPKPFENVEELEQTEAHLYHTIIPAVRAEVAMFLHRLWSEDIDEPMEFYQEIIEPWLTWFCQNYWVLYRCLKWISEHHFDTSFTVYCLPEKESPAFDSTLDFALKIQGNAFIHEWVASRIAEILADQYGWELVYKKEGFSNKENSTGGKVVSIHKNSSLSQVKQAAVRSIKYWLRCSSWELSKFANLGLNVLLAFKPAVSACVATSHPPSLPINKSAPNLAQPTKDDNILAAKLAGIAIQTMPTYFSRDLPLYWKKAKRVSFCKGKIRVVSSNIFDDDANIINYLAKINGEVTIGVQHGGGYGTHQVFPLVQETEYRHHYFISWGWRTHGQYKVNALPLPSPMLSRIAKNRRPRTDGKLLFVNFALQPLVLRLHSRAFGSSLTEEMGNVLAFFGGLSDAVLEKSVYRPHIEYASFEDPENLVLTYPMVNVLSGPAKNFMDELESCRLLVLNHPITVFHIAMAANVPMICYWRSDLWKFTDMCEELLDGFRRFGVIWDSPEKAAEKVNQVWPDVESWWKSPDIQAERRLWSASYALASRHWVMDWGKALWKL